VLDRMNLKVKVKGQDYQGQKTPAFSGPFGGLCAVYVW